MSTPTKPHSNFYFELSANGEQTTFSEVAGMSTEAVLQNNINPGENPFKFRLPSIPKGSNLVLKNGNAQTNSKLAAWCEEAKNPDIPTSKNTVTLKLKDTQGKSLVEWDLHSAFPAESKVVASETKGAAPKLEGLSLSYSYFTLSKK